MWHVLHKYLEEENFQSAEYFVQEAPPGFSVTGFRTFWQSLFEFKIEFLSVKGTPIQEARSTRAAVSLRQQGLDFIQGRDRREDTKDREDKDPKQTPTSPWLPR